MATKEMMKIVDNCSNVSVEENLAKMTAEALRLALNVDELTKALDLVVGSMALERVERFDLLEKCKSALAKTER